MAAGLTDFLTGTLVMVHRAGNVLKKKACFNQKKNKRNLDSCGHSITEMASYCLWLSVLSGYWYPFVVSNIKKKKSLHTKSGIYCMLNTSKMCGDHA